MWHTSNGDFATFDTGEVELIFPEFSSSKSARFEPDIIYLDENAKKPQYDLIIGTESLEKLNVIMDFSQGTLTMDGLTAPMRTKADMDWECSELYLQMKGITEQSSTKSATSRVKQILDAVYEKADIPRVIEDKCEHLSTEEKIL